MPLTHPSVLRCASAVLTALLLAGCTDEVAPAPTAPATSTAPSTSPTPSSSPSASPTPGLSIEPITTPPPVPADLKTPGQVGSKAVVEYFVALYGYTLNTGDTSLLRGISTPTCEYCNDLASKIEANKLNGLSVTGGGLDLVSAVLHDSRSTPNGHYWYAEVEILPTQRRSADGSMSERVDVVGHTSVLLAVWDGGTWSISASYDVQSDEAPQQ